MTLDPGWHVNDTLLPDLFDGNPVPTDKKKLERKLCDLDIREFALPCLSNCVTKESLTGPVILQLTRYRNVSQPKIKEDSRNDDDVVRLSLTDGHTSISAILLENVKGINADTPPGTKLLLTGKVPIEGGFVLLSPPNVNIIGGRVEKLIEKWMIERHSGGDVERGTRPDAKAPKWISFGKAKNKVNDTTPNDFKANDAIRNTNKKESEEQSTFDIQRKENIEAIEEGSVKTFTAPKVQPMVRPAQRLNEPKKPTTSAISDRGHDRRMKKRRGRGNEDSDDEEDNNSGRNPRENTHHNVQQSKSNSNGRNTRGGKSSYDNDRQRRPYDNKGGATSSFHKVGGVSQRAPSYGDPRLEKPHGGQRGQNNSQRPPYHQPNHRRNQPPRDNKREGYVNEYQQNPASTRTPNAYGGQNPYSHTQERNTGYIPDRAIDAFSNMRISSDPRSAAFNMPYPQKEQYCPRNQNILPQWKIGDQCKAPWTDGTYYLATVVNLGPADMCAVRYNEYGNIMTVPQAVLLLV